MRRHLLPVLLIAFLSIAVYAPALKNGFVYDDPDTVVNNTMIKDFSNLPWLFKSDYFVLSGETSYRPVVTFTYFLDYALFGLRPWGFHLTNILLHAINGIGLYIFLTLLLRQAGDHSGYRSSPPFLISLLFATHPVLTEAVNAVSFREDLLVFLYYIATLVLYLIIRRPTSDQRAPAVVLLYLLSCITYSLALFSKEMAVSLPLLICCYELIYPKDNKALRSVLFNSWNMGYAAVTIAYIYLRFSHLQSSDEIGFGFPEWSFGERMITFSGLFLNYLRLTLFPVSLSVDYMTPPLSSVLSISFIASIAVFASLLASPFLLMKREKCISFGILFFIITLAPVYNVLPIGHPVPLAERFLYLPAAGFAIVLGSAISMSGAARALYLYAFLAVVGIYITATVVRSMVWKDNYTLWSDTVRKVPENPFARYALGLECRRQGRFDEAKEQFQTSLRLRPEDPNAGDIYINLGAVSDEMGRFDDAEAAYRAAARLKPGDPMPNYNLGVAYAAQRRFDEAIQEFTAALRIAPGFIEARHNLGMAYMESGVFDKAREEFERALTLKPDFILSRKAMEMLPPLPRD